MNGTISNVAHLEKADVLTEDIPIYAIKPKVAHFGIYDSKGTTTSKEPELTVQSAAKLALGTSTAAAEPFRIDLSDLVNQNADARQIKASPGVASTTNGSAAAAAPAAAPSHSGPTEKCVGDSENKFEEFWDCFLMDSGAWCSNNAQSLKDGNALVLQVSNPGSVDDTSTIGKMVVARASELYKMYISVGANVLTKDVEADKKVETVLLNQRAIMMYLVLQHYVRWLRYPMSDACDVIRQDHVSSLKQTTANPLDNYIVHHRAVRAFDGIGYRTGDVVPFLEHMAQAILQNTEWLNTHFPNIFKFAGLIAYHMAAGFASSLRRYQQQRKEKKRESFPILWGLLGMLEGRSPIDPELHQANALPAKGLMHLLRSPESAVPPKTDNQKTDAELVQQAKSLHRFDSMQQIEFVMKAVMERDKSKHTSFRKLEDHGWKVATTLLGKEERKVARKEEAKRVLASGRGYYTEIQAAKSLLHAERRQNAQRSIRATRTRIQAKSQGRCRCTFAVIDRCYACCAKHLNSTEAQRQAFSFHFIFFVSFHGHIAFLPFLR